MYALNHGEGIHRMSMGWTFGLSKRLGRFATFPDMHQRGLKNFLTPVMCLLPACSLGTDSGLADNRGLLVAAYAEVAELAWSTDASELYFIEGAFRIRAVPANGSSIRTLYSSSVSLGDIRTVANKLYVSAAKAGTPAQHYIVRIDPGSPVDVDTVLTLFGTVRSHLFAVSADERFIAFGDSLFDLQTASRRGLPRGDPWSFSPDGSLLLYDLNETFSTAGFALIATSDGSSQSFSTATDLARPNLDTVGSHHWEGNDPKVLRIVISPERDHVQMSVQDVRTGANRAIGAVTNPPAGLYTAGTMSADGSRALVMIGAIFLWNELHTIDAQSLDRSIVARVTQAAGTDYLTISADGARIAYVVIESAGIKTSGDAAVYVIEQ
jgi:hypothetical protein